MAGLIDHLHRPLQLPRCHIVKNALDAVLLPLHPVHIPCLGLAAHIKPCSAMAVDFRGILRFFQIGVCPKGPPLSIPQGDHKFPDRLGQQQKGKQKKQPSKEVEKLSSRPKTHVMLRGESLTRISQKYYGTKDSVRAIIRINTFRDPDNVPVGAVVKLP